MQNTIYTPKGVLGNLISNSNQVEMYLSPGELFKVNGDKRGLRIDCRQGKLWITQMNDRDDHVLEAGERFVVSKPGQILVQSLGKSSAHMVSLAG